MENKEETMSEEKVIIRGLEYVLKELVGDDLDDDLDGFLLALKNLSQTGIWNIDDAKEILSRINQQNGHIYIVKLEGKIIGTTTLLVEQKFIHEGGIVGHIEDVAVRKGYEGKGIGSLLMKRVLGEAKTLGCYKVILDCSDDNVPFYKKFGFYIQENGMRVDIK